MEVKYIEVLFNQLTVISERIGKMGESIEDEIKNGDCSNVSPMLADIVDMLSNSYYLKISINRICDNESEELSIEGMPEEILESISQVNTFVAQVKDTYVSLQENVPKFWLSGLIRGNEYAVIKRQISDIHELVEKYENIKWNSFCVREDDKIVLEKNESDGN